MRTTILFILLIIACSHQQNAKNWYVSTTSSGNASGDSWANKISFIEFNTSLTQPGDTVFIDGGKDSLVYNLNSTWFIRSKGTVEKPIVYTRGKDPNHNGVPVFTSASNIDMIYLDNWNGSLAQYIEWSYTKLRPVNNASYWAFKANRSPGIYFLHNEVDYTYGSGIILAMADNSKIMYNYIYTNEVENPSSLTYIQNDAIKSNESNDWEIAYNIIINRTSIPFGDKANEPHRDLLQLQSHNLNGGQTLIHNNFLGTFFKDDSCFTNTLKANNAGGSFIFYNNILALYRNGGDIFTVSSNGEIVSRSLYVFNNTIIQTKSKAVPNQNSYLNTVQNVVFKNNLISIEYGALFSWSNMGISNIDFDYNIYNRAIPITSSITFSQWQSNYKQDLHSKTSGFTLLGDISASFPKVENDFYPAKGSLSIDEGTDLSSFFTDDFIGTKRPVNGKWDIGAFEFLPDTSKSSETIGDLKANVKVFLQGAFKNGTMLTSLLDNALLPLSQPYNKSPWNYNGSEVISSSLSSIVDWVLVELRSSQNPALIISRRAALLKSDGNILDTDGSAGVTFKNTTYGSYYIAVRHRNHLSIMSSIPVEFAPTSILYDFTKSQTSAIGVNSMAEVAIGVFGMIAGDGDANGNINDSDRNDIWSIQNGNMGYLSGDYNLDSGVTVKDTNNYWNVNQGKVAQVP